MKTRQKIGFARKLSKQILIKTCQKKGMIIKMRSDVTHLIEIMLTVLVLSQEMRLKDPRIGVKSLTY